MKYIFYISLSLILSSCLTNNYYSVAVKHLDSRVIGEKIIDSLRVSEVDTILGYYDGCSGCLLGASNTYYIFWIKNQKSFVTKVNDYSTYPHFKSSGLPFEYISSIIVPLQNEKLIEPKFLVSHYGYEIVTIITKLKRLPLNLRILKNG